MSLNDKRNRLVNGELTRRLGLEIVKGRIKMKYGRKEFTIALLGIINTVMFTETLILIVIALK